MPLNSTPISVKSLPFRYNVLYQKKSLTDDVGAIKIAGRALTNFGLNKYAPSIVNTLGEIGHFLSKHENTPTDKIEIKTLKKAPNLFELTTTAKTLSFPTTNDFYNLYQDKIKQQYYLWIPAYRDNSSKMVRIKAKDDAEFTQKIAHILSSDTARAKLECQTINPILHRIPFLPNKEIFFNEHKVVGHFQENAFDRINNHHQYDTFDTKIGSVDQKQLAYYLPTENFKNYSNRDDNKLNIKDDTFIKMHASSVFADAGVEIDEIIGNIILQTHAGQKLEPEFISTMSKKIKDDYIYNTYGENSKGAKINHKAFPILGPLSRIRDGKSGSRYQFANDPLRGGRFWHAQGMSHAELVRQLYEPQADGSTLFLYDKDPEAFMALADKMVIDKTDRQYTMNYGRKAIGARIAINFIQDELAKLNLDEKTLSPAQLAKNKLKQLDLMRFQSKLFDSLGDLKDTFRKSCVGLSAYTRAVGHEELPNIKEDKKFDRVTDGVPSEEGFLQSIHTGLDDYVEDNAYYEAFWGWQGREYVGRALFNLFKKDLFDKEVSDIVADNAVGMLAGVIDRSSRRMKSFSEFYLKDANLAANTKTFYDRLKRLDLGALSEIVRVQRSNINELLEGRKSYARTNVKRMILQNEGVSHNKEIWPTYNLKYVGNQRGRFNANLWANIVSWNKSQSVAGNLRPLLVDIARFMKAHQKSLIAKGINPDNKEYLKNDFVYKTPEMVALTGYIHKAAEELANDYFEKNKNVFLITSDKEIKILHKQVKIEYINTLNMIMNIVAMVAYMDEEKGLNLEKKPTTYQDIKKSEKEKS